MMAEAERNPPEIIQSDTLAQHSHPPQVTQGHVQSGLEYLQGQHPILQESKTNTKKILNALITCLVCS